MTGAVYPSVARAYQALARRLVEAPDYEPSPRGEHVRELVGVSFSVSNPRARVVTQPERGFNRGFAAGEFLWYLRGAEDVESLRYYNRRTPGFSDDGVSLAGAYGPRIFKSDGRPGGQWGRVVAELVRDPDSRRAVLQIFRAEDLARAHLPGGTKDVPCTLTLQFLVRGGALHAVATMRSCDLVWGLANDAFSFTLLQEVMALDLRQAGLGVSLGRYVHQAASLHHYDRHADMVRALAAGPEPGWDDGVVPPVESLADLSVLLRDELELRARGSAPPPRYRGGAYWLRQALEEHAARRRAETTAERSPTAGDLTPEDRVSALQDRCHDDVGVSRAARAVKVGAAAPAPADAVHVYTDGACVPNPGHMGIGVVVLCADAPRREVSEYLGQGTNNVAELTAILRGLEGLPRDRTVFVYSDSSYALGLLGEDWKAKANRELVERLRAAAREFSDVRWVKVAGHAGVPENERCDELARAAILRRR